MKLSLFFTALIATGCFSAAETQSEALPVFSGVLVSPSRAMVLLSQGNYSRWVELGRNFGDLKIEHFDAKSDTLTVVTGDGKRTELALKESKAGHIDAAKRSEAQRALWNRIKDLDGAKLYEALATADVASRSSAALTYLFQQTRRLESEAGAAKAELEKLQAVPVTGSDPDVRVQTSHRRYAAAVQALAEITDRLDQIALHEKKMIQEAVGAL